MLEYLHSLGPWDWLGLAAILLLFEVFGGAGYLLWISLSAGVLALLTYLFPELPWAWQLTLFAIVTLLSIWVCWQRQRNGHRNDGLPGLNQRGSELIGQHFELQQAIVNGRGKIRAGDTLWLVSGPDLPVGTRVKVVAQHGVIFTVEAV